MSNYFISCFSGAKNMGDEFILQCLIKQIKKQDRKATITVTSLNPKITEELMGGEVKATEWQGIGISRKANKNLLKLFVEIKSCDYVIIGGGGLLQDVHSVATIPRYLISAVLAKFFNKKVVYYSMGVGPIKNRHLISLTKAISNKFVDHITVRDEESRDYLTRMGINTEIRVTSDPVFIMDEVVKVPKTKKKLDSKKHIGISFRQFKTDEKVKKELEELISKLLATNKYLVSLFPLDLGEDRELCNSLKEKYDGISVIDKYINIEDLVTSISQQDFMISMRLHGVITSASYGIPSIAISYDEKVRSIQNKIGMQDFIIDIENFNAERCLNKLNSLEDTFKSREGKFNENIKNEKHLIETGLKSSLSIAKDTNKKVNKVRVLFYFVKLYIPQIRKKLIRY